MGGHWAVWLAQHPPPTIRAAVLYYSARAGDFTRATAPFLAHFAEADDFVTSSARHSMEHAITQRGLSYGSHEYSGTNHWFGEVVHPAYDPTAAEAAFDRTVSFIDSTA
jgi:carboxymethylenebutenolidase